MSLLQVTEPPEDRMEKALFSPSLSKQRVNYAVEHIKQTSATFLVYFRNLETFFLEYMKLTYSLMLSRFCDRLTLVVALEACWTRYWIIQLHWKILLVLTYL